MSASFVEIGGEGHAMMRRPRLWHQLAAGFLPGTLIPERDPSHTDQEPDFLRQAVRGEAHITL